MIDWEATSAMMQGWAALVAAFTAVVTAYAAIRALTAWRSQMIGQRKAQLAEEVLAAVYQAAEIIRTSRSPFASGDEGRTRQREPGETEDQSRQRDGLYAAAERLRAAPEFWASYESIRFRAKAYFGEAAMTTLNDVLRVRSTVHNASVMLAKYATDPDPIAPGLRARLESEMWDVGEDDEIKRRLAAAIASAETVFSPAITDRTPAP